MANRYCNFTGSQKIMDTEECLQELKVEDWSEDNGE